MKVKAWLQAMRLRTLPLALSSVWMGTAIVIANHDYSKLVFALALSTTILLQILSNFANDYGDFKNGADNENRIGPMRSVQSGAITARQMAIAIFLTGFLTLVVGIWLLYEAFWIHHCYFAFYCFLGMGIFGILAAYFYTAGSKPYGYIGLGDVSVFLFFGLLGVMGNAFLQTREWDYRFIFPSIAIGALSTAVLNLNNMRDRVNDKESGKITLAVRLGQLGAMHYQTILLFIAWAALLITFKVFSWRPLVFWSLLPILVQIIRWLKYRNQIDSTALDKELKPTALTTALIAFWLFFIA